MFAPRYFAPRFYAPRYWPPGITIVIVEAEVPGGVRRRPRRRYVRLDRLPEPAYIDRYIDEIILEGLAEDSDVGEVIKEALHQYDQTGEEDNIVLVMFMLDWI